MQNVLVAVPSKSPVPSLWATQPTGAVILVPGGAGFLGSHLCTRLIGEGHQVICLDNLSTGRRQNVAHLMATNRFSLIEHDVINPIDIAGPVDAIYNMACPASPPKYQADPVQTFRTSVDGARNLLDLARQKGARILQASTSEVYGDPAFSPQPESYWGSVNSYGPRACYDEGKRGAETLFFDYAAQYGVDTRIARIFNTYGPRMTPQDGRVVSNFVMQALLRQDITIYGSGKQTRSFCYVDDLVDGLMRLMGTNADFKGPVNLGNPSEFTMLELADLVLAKTQSPSKLVYRDAPTDDPRQRRPDITRAKTLLGWQPVVALDQGLDHMISHFADELGYDRAQAAS
jgi:UDP-glucuronate decarboxylase